MTRRNCYRSMHIGKPPVEDQFNIFLLIVARGPAFAIHAKDDVPPFFLKNLGGRVLVSLRRPTGRGSPVWCKVLGRWVVV